MLLLGQYNQYKSACASKLDVYKGGARIRSYLSVNSDLITLINCIEEKNRNDNIFIVIVLFVRVPPCCSDVIFNSQHTNPKQCT